MNIKQSLAKTKQKLVGENLNRTTLWVAFGLYLALLIWVIALKSNVEAAILSSKEVNATPLHIRLKLIPFNTFFERGFYFSLEYFLNVVIYVPMGIYLMPTSKENVPLCVLISFASSLAFEVFQFFTGFGGFDITDIVCNGVGGVVGILAYKLFRVRGTDKTANVVNLCVIVLSTPAVIFAIVNTIIHRHLYVIG